MGKKIRLRVKGTEEEMLPKEVKSKAGNIWKYEAFSCLVPPD